jgi:hypothetical protein
MAATINEPKSEASCVTPAWGAHFASAETSILLVETSGTSEEIHVRVQEADFSYSFFPVWKDFATQNIFGAQGNDILVVSMFGADLSVSYFSIFVYQSIRKYSGCAVVNFTEIECVTPAWGVNNTAANATVTFAVRSHQNLIDRSLDTRNDITRYTCVEKLHFLSLILRRRFEFYEVLGGIKDFPLSEIRGGYAQGNDILNLTVFGLDISSSYTCRFVNLEVCFDDDI